MYCASLYEYKVSELVIGELIAVWEFDSLVIAIEFTSLKLKLFEAHWGSNNNFFSTSSSVNIPSWHLSGLKLGRESKV